jgi:Tol biopolymer transport system component
MLAGIVKIATAIAPSSLWPVYDAKRGTTRRVSVSLRGGNPDGAVTPTISDDGRWVAFTSSASDLVRGDLDGRTDVFVYDVNRRTTRRISVGFRGRDANGASSTPAISSNGRFVAFASTASNLVRGDRNHTADVLLYDARRHTTRRITVGLGGGDPNGASGTPAIPAIFETIDRCAT